MSKEELLLELAELAGEQRDPESTHAVADKLLLDFINDAEIAEAYNKIEKWYA